MFPQELEPTVDGLVALGGDYTPRAILEAYPKGIFPWTGEHPVPWFSPDPRMILEPDKVRVTRSTRQAMRNKGFEVRLDTAFVPLILMCAVQNRPGQDGTWITPNVVETWAELNRAGHAHSVEVWRDDDLVGGLYGLSVGRAFFGESMVTQVPNASKVALVTLCEGLARAGYHFIDCQQVTDHLMRMGGISLPRAEFLRRLRPAVRESDGWAEGFPNAPAPGT